jgi:hypothetical protein
MMHSLFVAMSDAKMASLVSRATQRVALAAPGIGEATAKAIVSACKVVGPDKIFLIVDCDEEVFRLGYGQLQSLQLLKEAGLVVRQSSGLRIGVLVSDETAWIFSPTALYVQEEIHSDETPNAIEVRSSEVERLLSRIVPLECREQVVKVDKFSQDVKSFLNALSGQLPAGDALDQQIVKATNKFLNAGFRVHVLENEGSYYRVHQCLDRIAAEFSAASVAKLRPYFEHCWHELRGEHGDAIFDEHFDQVFAAYPALASDDYTHQSQLLTSDVEIGQEEVSVELIATNKSALDQAPPIPFDIARKVRVFEPYIQYVDISLKGCHIQRRTIELPKSVQGLDPTEDLSSRLHTKFDLIERSSDVSSERMDGEVKQLRDNFTKSLGKPWGRVMLRSVRGRFDEKIKELQSKLAAHKQVVESELSNVLSESRQRVIKHFSTLVRKSPPDALLGQITNSSPTEAQINSWLDKELDRAFPKSEELVTEMCLEVQFRDVTYETLTQPDFEKRLREEFRHVDWDKPFDEFDAAKARDDESLPKESSL